MDSANGGQFTVLTSPSKTEYMPNKSTIVINNRYYMMLRIAQSYEEELNIIYVTV